MAERTFVSLHRTRRLVLAAGQSLRHQEADGDWEPAKESELPRFKRTGQDGSISFVETLPSYISVRNGSAANAGIENGLCCE